MQNKIFVSLWGALLGAGAILAFVAVCHWAIHAFFDWLDDRVTAANFEPGFAPPYYGGESFESDYGFDDATDYFADFIPWLPVVEQADHRAMAKKADLN